jgi:hypothetical protein
LTRLELHAQINEILSNVNGAAEQLQSLRDSPAFDEDYKVAAEPRLNSLALDRLSYCAARLYHEVNELLSR